ncbi:hypothetical protein NPIL_132341 [Nephila pilipes]|uniref:Uncharacterized protein n=1 Tax=Nephila pilipes TaxID=299642 RepID=A0A8X6TZC1_NEPPI|nr:hypothetical protein NPIL_132341 [Nephila pilipes]
MLRMHDLITEEVMPFFENLSSDFNDTPVESSSDKERSTDDLLIASSSGFQNIENVDSLSYKDLEDQSVSRVWKKGNTTKATPILSLNSGFIESLFYCSSTPTS